MNQIVLNVRACCSRAHRSGKSNWRKTSAHISSGSAVSIEKDRSQHVWGRLQSDCPDKRLAGLVTGTRQRSEGPSRCTRLHPLRLVPLFNLKARLTHLQKEGRAHVQRACRITDTIRLQAFQSVARLVSGSCRWEQSSGGTDSQGCKLSSA